MAYGILKCDTITFTDGGVDKSVSISGLVQNPTFSGNITVTGTVSGNTIQGQTVSGVTVTGTTSNFASGVFTTQISGATVTGNVGSFTTITGGTVTLTSGVFGAGTASAPSIAFTGDLNTGIYSPGADQVAVATSGAGRLFIDSSGNVGVGANPTQRFSVFSGSAAGINNVAIFKGGGSSSGNGAGLILSPDSANTYGTWYGSRIATSFGGASWGCDLIFSTNNNTADSNLTERLRITSAGLVGVGVSAPGSVFHARLPNTSTAAIATFDRSDGAVSSEIHYDGLDGRITFGTTTNHPLSFETNNTRAVTIDTSQRVGIGTTSPGSQASYCNQLVIGNTSTDNGLTVLAGSNKDGTICFNDGDNTNVRGYLIYRHTTDSLDIGTNGSLRATIDSSGRLLVGTSSALTGAVTPSARLQIIGNTSNATDRGAQICLGHSAGAASIDQYDLLGSIHFTDNAAGEFARIEAYGDGVGGSGDYPGRLVFSTTADGASSPTQRLGIYSNGAIEITNGSFNLAASAITSGAGTNAMKYSTATGLVSYDSSSRLIKTEIVDCPYGIDAVKQLRPRKYFRIDDKRDEVGFVADEVASVLPEFVPFGKKSIITRNEEDTEEIPLGVNYDKLTAVLTKALQEAIAKIETLEAKVAALEIP